MKNRGGDKSDDYLDSSDSILTNNFSVGNFLWDTELILSIVFIGLFSFFYSLK